MRARLLANLNWLFADRVLRLVGGLLIGVWVARYLGPEQFGLLSYVMAFVALFGTVAKLGLDQIVVRDLSRSPESEGKLLGTVFGLKLVVSLVMLLLVILLAWVSGAGDASFIVMVAVIAAGMLLNALDAYDIYYQAHILSRYVVFARGAAFLLFVVVRVLLILGGYSTIYFAVAITLEALLGGAFLVLLFRQGSGIKVKWQFDRKVAASFLKDGWPFIISSALIVIHTRIDQVMIGQMLGNAEVGIYSVAMRLSESWLFIPMIITQTLMPYFVKLKEVSHEHYRTRLTQLYSIMFWLGALAGILTILLGGFFVVLLFGEQYRNAYMPLVITIWTGIFISQSVARGIWMVGENMQWYRLVNNLFAVPLNVLLNWILIPRYGVIGASAASFISIGLSVWVIPFFFKSMRESNRQMLLAINPRYLFVRN